MSDHLVIDLFSGDGLFHLDRVHDAGLPWAGAIGKATQGGPWLVQPMLDSVHVVFEAEARLHEMDCGCWCHPDVELRDPRTQLLHTKPLVTHRHGSKDA